MKDWHKLEPDVTRLMNKHFNYGRAGHKIDKVVVHHNAGVLTVDQIWQVWQTRQASAHYQVESGGRIGQLVYDDNTSWHAANSLANRTSIGIEISNSGGAAQDWPVAQKAIEEAGKLIGAVCYVKKLGRPRHGVNVFDHRRWTNTSCPHHLAAGGKYHNQLMGHAVAHYDWMANPAPTPEEDVMAADLNTIITTDTGEKHRAQDLIKWTDGRVYELTREGGTVDELKAGQQRIEAKLDQILKGK